MYMSLAELHVFVRFIRFIVFCFFLFSLTVSGQVQ